MIGATLLDASTCFKFIFVGFLMISLEVKDSKTQLIGSIQQCENEGEEVYIPNISDNPCISCFCKNREVTCKRERCLNLEGCYVVLFESLREERKCCEMCKGCIYNGKMYKSGEKWTTSDPCETLMCRAGVLTKSTTKCYTNCTDAIKVPGTCCPICRGCSVDGKDYQNGAEFTLSTDKCTKCKCKEGNVTCAKEACPVLNCPKTAIYQPEDSCCPLCRGQRRIFNLPAGYCFFQNKIYKTNQMFQPEKCTQCTCTDGTAVCEKETCPPISCNSSLTLQKNDSCCRVCPHKATCTYGGKVYQNLQSWRPNLCTMCTCDDGSSRCRVQHCRNSVWCPQGYKLRYVDGECCPQCMEAKGICTVFGDPHYRTFDGRIYNFQGACKYLLAEDEVGKTFSIRVRNDARTSPWFTWTRMLSIFLGNSKIGLHQKLNVKVNRKRVKLPFYNNTEFTIIRDGNSVVFNAKIGIKVVWDGDSFVEVTVSSRYKRRMAGLCGNYNGFGTDDLTGRDHKLYFDSEEFGNTWRVGGKAACVISDSRHTNSSLCNADRKRMKRAREDCSFLLTNVFSKCRKSLDVRPYYSSCISDTCDCPRNKLCACESYKAYGHACKQNGVRIRWERHILCPNRCPEGAVLKKCTRRCNKTCEAPDRKGHCRKKCQPGCLCPSSRVLHNNKCILPKMCPTP